MYDSQYHSGSASVGDNVNMIYEEDDIWLCTVQRAIPRQRLDFPSFIGVRYLSHPHIFKIFFS